MESVGRCRIRPRVVLSFAWRLQLRSTNFCHLNRRSNNINLFIFYAFYFKIKNWNRINLREGSKFQTRTKFFFVFNIFLYISFLMTFGSVLSIYLNGSRRRKLRLIPLRIRETELIPLTMYWVTKILTVSIYRFLS